MSVRSVVLAAAAALAASAAPAADTYVADKAHSQVAFEVRHLMVKAGGRFTDFDARIHVDRAKPEASSVEFRVKAASIDTANPDRDAHLRSADFFDVEKHPEVVFRSMRIVPRGGDRFDVTGILTLRGVSKEITLPVTFLGFARDPWGNDKAGFEATATLDRKDFGMVWNKALDAGGFILGDQVRLTITLETAKKKDAAD